MRRILGLIAVVALVFAFAIPVVTADAASHEDKPANPCKSKAENPCKPKDADKMKANPCNPCGKEKKK